VRRGVPDVDLSPRVKIDRLPKELSEVAVERQSTATATV